MYNNISFSFYLYYFSENRHQDEQASHSNLHQSRKTMNHYLTKSKSLKESQPSTSKALEEASSSGSHPHSKVEKYATISEVESGDRNEADVDKDLPLEERQQKKSDDTGSIPHKGKKEFIFFIRQVAEEYYRRRIAKHV
jgi:hypothetical protein